MQRKSYHVYFPKTFFWGIILGASFECEAFGQFFGIVCALMVFINSVRKFAKDLPR